MSADTYGWVSRLLNITVALSFVDSQISFTIDSKFTLDPPPDSIESFDIDRIQRLFPPSPPSNMTMQGFDDAMLNSVAHDDDPFSNDTKPITMPSFVLSNEFFVKDELSQFNIVCLDSPESTSSSSSGYSSSNENVEEIRTPSLSPLPKCITEEKIVKPQKIDVQLCLPKLIPPTQPPKKRYVGKYAEELFTKMKIDERELALISSEQFLLICNGLSNDEIRRMKDLRRRSKNKLAARECRKRRIESYDTLIQQVKQLEFQFSYLSQKLEILKSKGKILP